MILGIELLVALEIANFTRGGQQTVDVAHPDSAACVFCADAISFHGLAAQICDTDGRLTSAHEHNRVISECFACQSRRGIQSTDSNGCRSLNIIVECAIVIAVFVEESEGIMIAEIFELNERILTVTLDHGRHEFVDELVICRSGDTFLSQTNVQRVFQKVFVVGADIDQNGQALVRFDAGQGSVQ